MYLLTGSLLIIIFCNYYPIHGQILSSDARSLAKAGAVTAERGDHALFFNPAGLSTVQSFGILLSVGFPYRMGTLKTFSFGAYKNFEKLNVGLALQAFGDDIYQQSNLSFTLARNFGTFTLGIRPVWHRELFEGNDPITSFFLDAGTVWEISEQVNLGFFLRKRMYENVDRVYDHFSEIRSGIHWMAARFLKLSFQWNKHLIHSSTVLIAMTYSPVDRLRFMTGWRVSPSRVHLGLGFDHTRLRLDYGIAVDPLLGNIHEFSFRFGHYKS